MKIATIVLVIISLAAIIFLINSWHRLTAETDAMKWRAQIGIDHEDISKYLEKYRDDLIDNKMTSGHFALLFRTPQNDLSLHMAAVNDLLKKLEELDGTPKKEAAYQSALNDIRDTISEMPNLAFWYTWTKYWYIAVVFWPILCLVYLILVRRKAYKKEYDRTVKEIRESQNR